jgi:hypothetical protein
MTWAEKWEQISVVLIVGGSLIAAVIIFGIGVNVGLRTAQKVIERWSSEQERTDSGHEIRSEHAGSRDRVRSHGGCRSRAGVRMSQTSSDVRPGGDRG